MPQLNPNGLSSDYLNEYTARREALLLTLNGTLTFDPGHIESLKQPPIRRYEERFPPSQFENVITSDNRANVGQLNDLVGDANSALSQLATNSKEEFASSAKKFLSIADKVLAIYNR